MNFGTPRGTADLLVVFDVIVFLAFFGGWCAWVTRIRKKRLWRAGSIDPESKQERWHEDAAAVIALAFVLGVGVALVLLTVVLWRAR